MGKPNPDLKKVHYGGWEECEVVEIDWEKRIKEREEEEAQEERERKERITLAERLEKGWELMKVAVEFIKEHSPGWEISSERKMEEKKLEEEKRERLEKAAVKKRTTQEHIL